MMYGLFCGLFIWPTSDYVDYILTKSSRLIILYLFTSTDFPFDNLSLIYTIINAQSKPANTNTFVSIKSGIRLFINYCTVTKQHTKAKPRATTNGLYSFLIASPSFKAFPKSTARETRFPVQASSKANMIK